MGKEWIKTEQEREDRSLMWFIWTSVKPLIWYHATFFSPNCKDIDWLTVQWMKNCLQDQVQRVKVNDSKSRWRSLMVYVPQGSVLGPMLFSIFINDIDTGDKCTLSKFAGDTKLWDEINIPEEWDVIQRDLDKQSCIRGWWSAPLLCVGEASHGVLHPEVK